MPGFWMVLVPAPRLAVPSWIDPAVPGPPPGPVPIPFPSPSIPTRCLWGLTTFTPSFAQPHKQHRPTPRAVGTMSAPELEGLVGRILPGAEVHHTHLSSDSFTRERPDRPQRCPYLTAIPLPTLIPIPAPISIPISPSPIPTLCPTGGSEHSSPFGSHFGAGTPPELAQRCGLQPPTRGGGGGVGTAGPAPAAGADITRLSTMDGCNQRRAAAAITHCAPLLSPPPLSWLSGL